MGVAVDEGYGSRRVLADEVVGGRDAEDAGAEDYVGWWGVACRHCVKGVLVIDLDAWC